MANTKLLGLCLATGLLLPVPAGAQRLTGTPNTTPPNTSSAPPAQPNDLYGGYSVSVGDILDVHVADEDDVTGRYQVNQQGNLQLPLLTKPIPAAGETTFSLAKEISEELVKEQILRQPSVTVFIAREMGQDVTVLGPVARPGVITLERPTTLIELLSLAGGLQANAGSTLTITSTPVAASSSSQNAPHTITANIVSVDIGALMAGKNPDANVLIHGGDVVTVSIAPIIYVVGAVAKPGAYTVQDWRSDMTVMKAIAMAEGTQPTAALNRAIIVRHSSDANREEIPLDLKKIMTAKEQDQVLEANDILFVPQSTLKVGLHRMGDIAGQAAGTAIGYGIGLSIARQ